MAYEMRGALPNRFDDPAFVKQVRESFADALENILTAPNAKAFSAFANETPEMVRRGERIPHNRETFQAFMEVVAQLEIRGDEKESLKALVFKTPGADALPRLPKYEHTSRLSDPAVRDAVLKYVSRCFDDEADAEFSAHYAKEFDANRGLYERLQKNGGPLPLRDRHVREALIMFAQNIRLTPDEIDELVDLVIAKE